MDSYAQKLWKRTRRDSGRLSPTHGSRRGSQSTLQPVRIHQASIPFPTSEPEPSTSFSSEESVSQWRREEIRTLPRELLGQCLLTMQARGRHTPAIPDRSLITTPEDIGDMAAASQDSTVRSMFGSDINASCFAERERARQMQILIVMWSRGWFQPESSVVR
ncbi:hypothetical protein BDM02DRAFT_2349288 [Thelephora ganbajun]|uniref:Uncharacterized protein n=1 Tax=Thelephora ganbajun TaxID=370292 RepID=A0ACB6YYH3_THEGA|nr:hypothetical protein BDM02DRAFT_2349288 [Thelephora ganbajun]